ncbi:MAG: putative NACHT family NTPase, partial [Roseivirga sp.]
MKFQLSPLAETTAHYINTTSQHIFLTGKAGTGKTTFLKHIVSNTHKKTVVAAPTGIAAINANGVTLHSLLQLPFGAFIPERISPPNT